MVATTAKFSVNETETVLFYKCFVTFADTKSLNSLLTNVTVTLLVMLTPLNVADSKRS